MSDNRNMILAIVLSVLILIGFQYGYDLIYPKPAQPPVPAQQETVETAPTAPGTAAPGTTALGTEPAGVNIPTPGSTTAPAATPSALVFIEESLVMHFSSRDIFIAIAPIGETPMTFISGRTDFTAIAMPLISPPPPIGTSISSTSSSSLSISSPIVPCPHMTS